jgi:hypothetical protein
VTLDARIDPELADDEYGIPLLMWERVGWDESAAQRLPPGQGAVLVLHDAWGEIFNGGMVQLLYNFGHRIDQAAPAARLLGLPEYEELFAAAAALVPEPLPVEHYDRSLRVDDLLEDEDVDARLEALEERYYEIEDEAGSPVDCALSYVREHPDEFFLSAAEVAADLDDFVARLAARVGPITRAREVSDELAPLLQRLYREVGERGWGRRAGSCRRPSPSTGCCWSSGPTTGR